MAEALLRAEHLKRTLEGDVPVTLVHDASLEVRRGEFVSITGPSGSGKSSLLYLLGLLDRPTAGKIFIEGEDALKRSDDSLARLRLEKMGFIFQSHFLLPEFSALENVMIPMQKLGKLGTTAMRDRAHELLSQFGLGEHVHKRPKQMSGGQSQRVAIARALANDPLMVLADEPTGNLDTASGHIVQKILRELATEHGRTVISVTHDPAFAATATREVHIVDGKIARDGS